MSPIEFANPVGWWWAGLAIPIVAFYFLKVRLRRQPVSTLLFWNRVFDEKQPRAWWQQLRHWTSLLLQLALLTMLVAAIVDPIWSWQKTEQRKLVLIVDNSASMAAESGGTTRLEFAKREAAFIVRSLRPGDELAILTAAARPVVAIGFAEHPRSLFEAIDRIEQTDAPNSLTSAVSLAKQLLSDAATTSIHIITDGCGSDASELFRDESLDIHNVGQSADNIALTQFQVRRSLSDATGYEALIEVKNFGSRSQPCRLELTLEGKLVDVIPLELQPDASKTLNLEYAAAEGGRFIASLKFESSFIDGLAADNQAFAVLPARERIPIAIAGPDTLFLKSVLQSIPLVELTNEPANKFITVLHREIPNQLPEGKLLVINPLNDCDFWTVGQPIDAPIVGSVDKSSPVTQHVRLDNILFPGAREMQFVGVWKTLVKTPLDQPLLSRLRRPSGDVIALNVDLDLGDLPLRIAFPVLMKNAIEQLQGLQVDLQTAIATGQTTTVDLQHLAPPQRVQPPREQNVASDDNARQSQLEIVNAQTSQAVSLAYWIQNPTGERTPLTHGAATTSLTMLDQCGFWTIGTSEALDADPWNNATSATDKTADASQLVRLACNLCNADESDLRLPDERKPRARLLADSFGGWPIWFYLVFAGLIFTAIEWWLYQRRLVG